MVKFEKTVMLLSVFVMLISVALQVYFRYVAQMSVPWTEEVALIAFVVMVFYGATLAVYHDRHLGIKNVIEKLTERNFKIVWFLKKSLLGLFLLIVMVLFSSSMVREGLNQTYTITRIPLFYVFLQIPIFGCFSAFHIIMSFLRKDYLHELPGKNKEN